MKPTTDSIVMVTGALLLTTLFASTAAAQGPQSLTQQDGNVMRFEVGHNGIRTGGSHYRANFATDGFTFTPALGTAAPHTMPLRYAFESVRRGNQTVVAGGGLAAQPEGVGTRVEYDRGEGVTERYDVRGNGVKQSFVFEQLPGSGELIVSGRIHSELAAPETADANTIDFVYGNVGGVRFEEVIGIDANGARATGTMRWNGLNFDMILPASFVDNAQFPLVLDPLVGTHRMVGTSGNNDSSSDCAWLDSESCYLVAWERKFSNTDIEIRARLFDEDNNALTGYIALTSGNNTLNLNPSVGTVIQRNRFVVAWQSSSSLLGPSDIKACSVDGTGSFSNATTVTWELGSGTVPQPTSANERHPTVIRKPNSSALGTHIVYENTGVGIEVRSIAISSTGTISASNAPITVAADASATKPRLSGGHPSDHAIVWQSKNSSGFDTVKIARLTNGTPSSTIATISNNSSHRQNPDVDGTGSDFRIVFETGSGILTRDLTFVGGVPTLGPGQWITVTSATEFQPRIALLGPKYLVTWTKETAFLDYEIHGRTLEVGSTLSWAGSEFTLGGSRDSETQPAIATQRAGGSLPSNAENGLISWSSASIVSGVSDVRSQRIQSYVGATPTVLNSGCGIGATLDTNGPVALGNANLKFELSSSDANPLVGVFLIGFGSSLPCPGGSCVIISPVITSASVFLWPTQTLTMPVLLPADTAFVGHPLEVQGLVLGTAANVCAPLPDASFTDRLGYVLDF